MAAEDVGGKKASVNQDVAVAKDLEEESMLNTCQGNRGEEVRQRGFNVKALLSSRAASGSTESGGVVFGEEDGDEGVEEVCSEVVVDACEGSVAEAVRDVHAAQQELVVALEQLLDSHVDARETEVVVPQRVDGLAVTLSKERMAALRASGITTLGDAASFDSVLEAKISCHNEFHRAARNVAYRVSSVTLGCQVRLNRCDLLAHQMTDLCNLLNESVTNLSRMKGIFK